jgi:hypothetical protein
MTTTDERTTWQLAKSVEEMLKDHIPDDHARHAETNRRLDRLAKRVAWGIASPIVLAAALGAYASITTANATAVVKEKAVEATRQEFGTLRSAWQAEFRAECRARDTDLAYVADLAASKAVKAVVLPTEAVTAKP